jgi:hypothetical protein
MLAGYAWLILAGLALGARPDEAKDPGEGVFQGRMPRFPLHRTSGGLAVICAELLLLANQCSRAPTIGVRPALAGSSSDRETDPPWTI